MLFFCARGMISCSGDGHLVGEAAFRHFGQQISLHYFRHFAYFPLDARSILHVFQGTQCIWWGGVGGGGDNVRWNFYTCSILHVFQGAQNLTM